MKITVVRPGELGESELARWRSFQDATPALANPFLSPELTVAIGRLRDQARVAVLSDGSQAMGFFPFERRRLGGGVPIGAPLTDCQGLVHASGFGWEPQELLRACGLAVWEFDHLVDGQLPFEPYQTSRAASGIMDLAGGYHAYLTQLSSTSARPGKAGETKESVRRLQRKERALARLTGELRFDFASRDHAALRTVLDWKSAQYLRTGVTDWFARPWVVQLLDQLLDTATSSCAGVLSMLYADDEPIAGHFGLRSDRVMILWLIAYAQAFAKYSPGLLLHLRMAEAAAAEGIQHINMGPGPHHYKNMFSSRDVFVGGGRVVRRSPAAAVQWTLRTPDRWLRHVVKGHPALHGAAGRVRQRYSRIDSALRRRGYAR